MAVPSCVYLPLSSKATSNHAITFVVVGPVIRLYFFATVIVPSIYSKKNKTGNEPNNNEGDDGIVACSFAAQW